MKTKNIFRMLLVAAALLMGANNAMADAWSIDFRQNVTDLQPLTITNTTNIGGTTFGEAYWVSETIIKEETVVGGSSDANLFVDASYFENTNNNTKIRVYATITDTSNWKLYFGRQTDWSKAELEGVPSDGNIYNTSSENTYNGEFFEYKFGDNTRNILFYNGGLAMSFQNMTVTKVSLVNVAGSFDSKIRFQNVKWILRNDPSHGKTGLQVYESGARSIALTNCIEGETITINATTAVDITSNITLVSSEGDNYVYTVNADGDVVFKLPKDNQMRTISIAAAPTKYSVYYYIDNELVHTDKYFAGATIIPYTPTKEGYVFNGWNGLPETMPNNDLYISGSYSKIYNINLSYNHEQGTVSCKSQSTGNEQISFTVTPNSGYEIANVSAKRDDTNQALDVWNSYETYMPAGTDITITVTFNQIGSTPTPHNVYIANGIQGGSVTANPTSAAPGTTVTLTAQPNQGYRFASWNVYGNNQSIAVNNNQFTMPDYDVTVSANFEQIYTVSVSSGSNGSASVDKTTAAANETVTITTNPNSGYEVDAVTVANVNVTKDANVNNRYTFTMPANNVTVNVTFKAATQSPNFEILNNAIETVGSTDLTSPRYGGMSTPITIADGGTLVYKFRNNTDGQDNGHSWMVLAATSEANLSNPESNATVILRNDNWEIRAWNRDNITENFNWDTFINDMNGSDVTMTIQYTNGRFSVSSSIRTTGGTTYNYSYWKDIPGSPSQMVTCLSVEKAYLQITQATYTAPQEQSTTYTVTVNAGSGGTASADKQSYEAGETVTITTRPTNGYVVSSVTVAGEDADYVSTNTYSFTMPTNNVTVYVTFELETQGTPDQVVIGSTGYATYSNAENAINLSGLSGAKAYIATAISLEQNKVTLTQVRGVVAANTGLIIISDNKQPGTFNMPIALSTGTSYSNNLLLASDGNTTLSKDDSDYTYYVLVERSGVAKFAEVYSYDADLDAGKAYLRTDKVSHASARTRGLSIEINNGTTGINGVENEQRENVIYNLRGQRMENPTKGLYIINGKKVIIK